MFDKIKVVWAEAKALFAPGWQVRGVTSLIAGALPVALLNYVVQNGVLNLVLFLGCSGAAFYYGSKKWPLLGASKK